MNGTSVSNGTRPLPIDISHRSFRNFPESFGKWKTPYLSNNGHFISVILPVSSNLRQFKFLNSKEYEFKERQITLVSDLGRLCKLLHFCNPEVGTHQSKVKKLWSLVNSEGSELLKTVNSLKVAKLPSPSPTENSERKVQQYIYFFSQLSGESYHTIT